MSILGCAMQYVGSQFSDKGLTSCPPEVEVWSLNHWTAREVPAKYFKRVRNFRVALSL